MYVARAWTRWPKVIANNCRRKLSQETSDEETATLVELIIIMLSEPEGKNESCRIIKYWGCDSDDPCYLLAFYVQSTPTTRRKLKLCLKRSFGLVDQITSHVGSRLDFPGIPINYTIIQHLLHLSDPNQTIVEQVWNLHYKTKRSTVSSVSFSIAIDCTSCSHVAVIESGS